MRIHTVFITYNRLELTKQAPASYLETVTLPFSVGIVDNGSTDGTQEWLRRLGGHYELGSTIVEAMMFPNNRYPGAACNYGFTNAPSDATHLHRADNDFIFLPGWCEEVERMFSVTQNLGQLGLRTDAEEDNARLNVGGNCVILRELWDGGLRWDERPWPQIRDEVGAGWTEDSLMSKSVKKTRMPVFEMGHYTWDRVERPCIQSISVESADDPYYRDTWADRGISDWAR
mgnify:CR=1 FL=1